MLFAHESAADPNGTTASFTIRSLSSATSSASNARSLEFGHGTNGFTRFGRNVACCQKDSSRSDRGAVMCSHTPFADILGAISDQERLFPVASSTTS